MNKTKMTVAEFLFQCNLRISNTINDGAIQEKVAPMGYTAEKMQEGNVLLESAKDSCQAFEKEHGDVDHAFADRNREKEAAHITYMQMVEIGKVALKNDTGAQSTLQLTGRRPTTWSGWIKQTRNFYHNLMENEPWMAAMAGFGMTEEKMQAGLEQVLRVEKFAEVIMREQGDAQNATQQRDAKLEELHEWVSDYEVIARLALTESPQLLEKLGIVVKA
ncbi:hypothetical protein DMA11_20010 [Marinilabiliaceae bacterium JC017]|nr:hypothetical protein DMA11_20010 [Marinilabiliaceae bacterium JC017]